MIFLLLLLLVVCLGQGKRHIACVGVLAQTSCDSKSIWSMEVCLVYHGFGFWSILNI